MARHYNAAAYKKRSHPVSRKGMGFNVVDFLKNPKAEITSELKNYEESVSNYFKDNLPPEVYAEISEEVAKLGPMTQEEIQKKLQGYTQKYILTDSNVDSAAKTGISASFNKAGDAFANQYQLIADQLRAGTLFPNMIAGKGPWASYLIAGLAAYVPLAMVFKEQKFIARIPVVGSAAYAAYLASTQSSSQVA